MKRKLSYIILVLMLSIVSLGAFAAGEAPKAPVQPAPKQTAQTADGAQNGEMQTTAAQDANAAKPDEAKTAQDAKTPTDGAQDNMAQNQLAAADGAQGGTVQNQPAAADGTAAFDAQGANAAADTTQTETALTVTVENSLKEVSVALNLDDATVNDFLAKYAARTDKSAPAVLDLTALGAPVDVVELPSDLINAVLNDGISADPMNAPADTSQEETAEDTGNGVAVAPNAQADTAPQEQSEDANGTIVPEAILPAANPEQVILLIHTHGGKDYSWKRGTLQALPLTEMTVKLEMGKADQTMVFNMPEDAPKKAPSALDFKPQDGKYKGVLSVAKTAEGTWKVTGSYMFGSVGSYIVTIVLLVLLTLLVMIAVNLLIIKFYRMK